MEKGWEIKNTPGGAYYVDGYAGHLFNTALDASTALKLAQQMIRNDRQDVMAAYKKLLEQPA